jgi:hypothetical protein
LLLQAFGGCCAFACTPLVKVQFRDATYLATAEDREDFERVLVLVEEQAATTKTKVVVAQQEARCRELGRHFDAALRRENMDEHSGQREPVRDVKFLLGQSAARACATFIQSGSRELGRLQGTSAPAVYAEASRPTDSMLGRIGTPPAPMTKGEDEVREVIAAAAKLSAALASARRKRQDLAARAAESRLRQQHAQQEAQSPEAQRQRIQQIASDAEWGASSDPIRHAAFRLAASWLSCEQRAQVAAAEAERASAEFRTRMRSPEGLQAEMELRRASMLLATVRQFCVMAPMAIECLKRADKAVGADARRFLAEECLGVIGL